MFKKTLLALALCSSIAHADIVSIPVDKNKLGWFDSDTPTLTYTQPAANAKGTVLIVMGGEGRINLERGESVTYRPTINMLRPLTTKGYNLVVIDSPYDLVSQTDMGQPRFGRDHQRRIDEVVAYYKNLYGFPVWLYGHSAGAVSVAEYANRVKSDPTKLAGLIISGEHERTYVDVTMTVPTLIIHHESDPCPKTNPYLAERQYKRILSNTTSRVELAWVRGGQGGDACRGGYHMYTGQLDQAGSIIESFIK
jgi:pimeloyl-ACP methyl ester carboxylesterase